MTYQALGISIGSAIVSSGVESRTITSRSWTNDGTAIAKIPFYKRALDTESSISQVSPCTNTSITDLQHVWIFCAAACAVALIGSLGIESFPLDQPLAKAREQDPTCDEDCAMNV